MNTSSSANDNTTLFSYPANARELPKKNSPLARDWVAPGHCYDETTGLVKPHQIAL